MIQLAVSKKIAQLSKKLTFQLVASVLLKKTETKGDVYSTAIEDTVKPTTNTNVTLKKETFTLQMKVPQLHQQLLLETPMFLILIKRIKYGFVLRELP